jgi:hypothetical protein
MGYGSDGCANLRSDRADADAYQSTVEIAHSGAIQAANCDALKTDRAADVSANSSANVWANCSPNYCTFSHADSHTVNSSDLRS